ncbi:MAG TPA: hypothetical protein VJR92_08985 [Gemmatimonadaceae bacterium]|nr:hypothetical protein [Gemmatimonadaceae bacterium]
MRTDIRAAVVVSRNRFLVVIAVWSFAFGSLRAQPDAIVATRHTATVNGATLRYTARAGLLPIRDNEAGEVRAHMYFVAYTLDRAPGAAARPLTFLWNGGPGSNAGLLHLLGFGPKRIAQATGNAPRFSPNGTTLIDNDGTWLDKTDLVFVDPVGTGYSRPVKAEDGADFYQSRGDAESVAEFIRTYRTRFDAFAQPLFIMGESYGVTRAALVSEALERRGTTLSGVIMLGLALPLGDVPAPTRAALGLPTFTAAAFASKKLPAELQTDLQSALKAAQEWSEKEYAPALARRDSLNATERDAIVAQVARFSGMPAAQVDRNTLRLTMERVSAGLLEREGRVVGRYDSRMTDVRDTTQTIYDPTKDPSLKDILDGISVIRYMRNVLGYKNDMNYQGPFGGGYPPPTAFRGDWMSVKWNRTVPVNATASLRAAMTSNAKLAVFISCGYYDMVCDYYGNEYTARTLEPALAKRVTARSYAGGHAVYTDDRARLALKRDVAAFIDANK